MYNFVQESKRELVKEYLWKQFESNLSYVDDDLIIDVCMSSVEDMGLDGGDIGIEETLDYYWEERYGYLKMKRRADEAGEKFYEKECSIYNALAKYYERTFKDVNWYISFYRDFFKRLSDVDKIFVIGHSMGDGDNIKFMNKIASIGVKMENIKVLKSEKFFNSVI